MHTETRRRAPGSSSTATAIADAHEYSNGANGNPENGPTIRRTRKRVARVSVKNTSSLLYPLLGILGIAMFLWSRQQQKEGDVVEEVTKPPPVILTMRRNNPHFAEHAQQQPEGGKAFPPGARRENSFVIGDRTPRWLEIQRQFQTLYPDNEGAKERRLALVESLRKRTYYPINPDEFDNDRDCPEEPPEGYPKAWSTLDIVNNWGPDDMGRVEAIYQGICIFDYNKPGDIQKANNYREAELPFVMRNDPEVLKSVERWNDPSYLKRVLEGESHRAEYSLDNHFMYWNGGGRARDLHKKEGWKPPTKMIEMTYDDWLSKANVTEDKLGPENPHWYFRLIGCGEFRNCDHIMSEWLFDDLSFFYPRQSMYVVDPREQKGIHCRFGMKGVIAENHFDGSRNVIALLGGERRYILSHPNECRNLALLPKNHPSGRHSAVDWSNPDVEKYPQFKDALSNEVVLQAGDVLYLPTNW